MPALLLIRHGENDFVKQGRLPGRMPGIHLNKRGQVQAAALAESLKNLPIRSIYASPLERAVETAEPLAQSLGLAIQLLPGLQDTDVGEWQGTQLKKLRKLALWKQVQEHPSEVRFPGGESFLELQQRQVKEIDLIRTAHKPREMIAVVFHCDPIKLVLAHYIGLPLDGFQKFVVAPGSVSILMLGKTGGLLAALNLRPPFVLDK
ncbi:MAG: histidine phosphatase family protein [Anaerolineales bacterium]|jgi:probable phosphoglycerate mutase